MGLRGLGKSLDPTETGLTPVPHSVDKMNPKTQVEILIVSPGP